MLAQSNHYMPSSWTTKGLCMYHSARSLKVKDATLSSKRFVSKLAFPGMHLFDLQLRSFYLQFVFFLQRGLYLSACLCLYVCLCLSLSLSICFCLCLSVVVPVYQDALLWLPMSVYVCLSVLHCIHQYRSRDICQCL